MKIQANKLMIFLSLVFMLSACNKAGTQSIVEITRLVPQTIEVTRIVSQLDVTPESNILMETPNPSDTSPSLTVAVDSSSVEINPTYFDGVIVLSQFYMFLEHGLYEEAVSLFSSSKQSINGTEADVAYFESSLDSIEIRFIYPFDYWLAQQEREPLPTHANELRYVTGTMVIYKGKALNSEGTPTPHGKTSFVSLILEDDKWRINEINSSPWNP